MFIGNVYFGHTALANTPLKHSSTGSSSISDANVNLWSLQQRLGKSFKYFFLDHWGTLDACEWHYTLTLSTLCNTLSTLSLFLSKPSLYWLGSDDDIHFHSERHGEDGLLKEDHKEAWGSHPKALQVTAKSPKTTFLTFLTTHLSVQQKRAYHIGEIKRF